MDNTESLGDLLRRLRGELTLREAAKNIGVKSPQTIGNWERELQLLPEDKISLLKKIYEVLPEDAVKFDHLYAEAKRRKAFATGPTLIEHDQGAAPMIAGLENLAALARQESDIRYVLHSVSNYGFMTHDNAGLQAAVFECAQAGVDVVFFPQPGAESLNGVKSLLIGALKTGIEDYAFQKHDDEINRIKILQRFSVLNHKYSPPTFPLPAAQDDLETWAGDFAMTKLGLKEKKHVESVSDLVMCVSAAANWLGSMLRFLVEIKVEKANENRVPELGSIERTCPKNFQVERIWLHLVTHSADKGVKKHAWVHISDESGLFAIEYGRELAARRQRRLLESSLLFKSKT